MNLRIHFFQLLAFLLIAINAFGQAKDPIQRLDSAFQYCLAHPTDSIALNTINSATNRLYGQYSDTVRYYAEQQVKLAEENGFTMLKGRGYIMWGICMEFASDLDSAIALYRLAEKEGQKINNRKLLLSVYNNLGIVYSYKSLYQSSLEYTFKALQIAEELNDENSLGMVYNNIGLRYSELRNQDKARFYYQKAIALNKKINSGRLNTNYLNLARSFFLLERFDSAKYYYQTALELTTKFNNDYNSNLAYSGLAYCFIKTDRPDLARLYNDSASTLAVKIGDEYGQFQVDMIEGYILEEEGKIAEAAKKFELALDWAEERNYMGTVLDLSAALAQIMHRLGNNEQAYNYMKRYAFEKDSSFTKQKDLAMQQVELYKEEKQAKEKEVLNQELALKEQDLAHEKSLRNTFILVGVLLLIIAIGLSQRYLFQKRTNKEMTLKNALIEKEKARSDELLLNILPEEVAEELKQKGSSEARDFDHVTVMFTDFVEFTKAAEAMSAKELVKELNTCFEAFDEIIDKYRLEKIKTIGDAYMAASGLNTPKRAGAKEATLAALEMQEFINQRENLRQETGASFFKMRCGLNTGPVVAGIVGVKKFQFDIWGDTVNTAQRMESHGQIGKVNISEETFLAIKDEPEFTFVERGILPVKGKGNLPMYFVSKIV